MDRAPGRRLPSPAAVAAAVLLPLVTAIGCSGDPGGRAGRGSGDEAPPADRAPVRRDRDDALPTVTPTPRAMRWIGPDVEVPPVVDVVVDPAVDEPTRALVADVLARAGADDVRLVEAGAAGANGDEGDGDPPRRDPAALTVRFGPPGDDRIARGLDAAGLDVPDALPAEGYALAAFVHDDPAPGGEADGQGSVGSVVVAAGDAAGWFYAAQTLAQVTGDGRVAGVGVVDHPAMPLRGTIEGFYGSPWTQAERLDQLAFYGRFKLNTYVYAPKDDPFHRDRWRDPYPPERVQELQALVDAAVANHVRFTFAVSPGVSICYSDADDRAALLAKLQAMFDVGVRSFSIALDDIDPTTWNCGADAQTYGPPTTEAAARAQAALVNAVHSDFVATHEGVASLQMVPTEYRRTDDSPYRAALRSELDPAVQVMWTGALVVPPEITVAEAGAAAEVFGRPTLIWDNTPVNDYPATEGRLLLGPYARREPGLAAHVAGLVLNPMNQAAASKVALVGAADFAWNDTAYDPARAWRAAAVHLAGGDAATTEALLAFFDVEHLAPTSGDGLSQPQAPALAAQLDGFALAWAGGDRAGAVEGLRPYAERLASAPGLINDNVVDPGFLADCEPWLRATDLWGQALLATLDGLAARAEGDAAAADDRFAAAAGLAGRAEAIHTVPGETRPQGPVRVADGVLDAFIAAAPGLD